MNRVEAAIAKAKIAIENSGADQAKLDKNHKALDMPFDEYCRFQTMKSAAMGTMLNTDEAQSIYNYLGNTPEQFNRQPLEVMIVLSKIFAELLERRIKAA